MTIHVFVVDDDSSNLRVASHILTKNEMRATTLSSGQALLEALSVDNLPDLILLDIKMPEMDGFETLKRLRAKESKMGINEIPVIFLTADETADTEKLGFEAGVSDYIRKPFDPDILLRRVSNIVSKEKRLTSLRTDADTDKLTGFLNKAASARVISSLCASDLGCLMMIDLDSFKLVNDLYGHNMGDTILISFAEILRNTMPENSRLGRIGGDEFIAFVSGMQSEDMISAATKKINDDLVVKAKELMGEDMGIPLGASIGAVLVPQHGDDYDTVFKLADKALYTVKKNGKHGCALYQEDNDTEDDTDTSASSISRISEILGERSIPNVALQLNKDAFSYVYRYIMRYIVRNQQNIYKVLFTLQAEDGTDERSYKAKCDEFGDLIRESLRKTDVLMRNRFNQYFVLLTDVKENSIDTVIANIIHRWNNTGGTGLVLAYDSEFISIPYSTHKKVSDMRIAVVDDDEATLRFAGTALSKAGFRVAAMKSGRALLKYVSEQKPDLILLDTAMPEQDGFETLQLLRGLKGAAEIPVILLTEDNAPETDRRCLSLGADEIIRKPVVPELLVHRVRHVTELAARRGASHASR